MNIPFIEVYSKPHSDGLCPRVFIEVEYKNINDRVLWLKTFTGHLTNFYSGCLILWEYSTLH